VADDLTVSLADKIKNCNSFALFNNLLTNETSPVYTITCWFAYENVSFNCNEKNQTKKIALSLTSESSKCTPGQNTVKQNYSLLQVV